ncbi:MAG: GAF domain-containing protein [Candidatus Bathyarchaeota archaeon]|nr:MAG: GAF domain-containing protein [Candidatus Bathyarchaeota archaeon]
MSSLEGDLQDVTGDRRYEETLVSLHNFAKILSECQSREEVYATTIDAMEKTLNFERVDILMIEGETLKQVAAHETLPKGIELPLDGPGVTVKAVHEKSSILVNNVNQNDDYLFVLDPATGEPDRRYALSNSELVSPILIDGRAAGVLNVESPHIDAFTEQDRMLLEILAIHVANAISRIERVDELEEMIAKRTRELVNAERMVAGGRIASMVGHDLRGPLQAIKNAVYMLKNFPERSDEMIDLIDRVVEQANAMIEELRNQIRDDPLQLSATDLARLIREAIGQAAIPQTIDVEIELDENIGDFVVDATQIRRVIDNLVRNAVDAMLEKGRLELALRRKGRGAEIQVSDTGVGIPDDERVNLFKPFYTTKVSGLGLGLAYCKRAVEAHGGTIRVASTVGEGTTFTIFIPNGKEPVREPPSVISVEEPQIIDVHDPGRHNR